MLATRQASTGEASYLQRCNNIALRMSLYAPIVLGTLPHEEELTDLEVLVTAAMASGRTGSQTMGRRSPVSLTLMVRLKRLFAQAFTDAN